MKFQSVSSRHPVLLPPADLPLLNSKILTALHGILFLGSKSIDLFIVRIYFRVTFIYLPQNLLHEFVGEKLYSQLMENIVFLLGNQSSSCDFYI